MDTSNYLMKEKECIQDWIKILNTDKEGSTSVTVRLNAFEEDHVNFIIKEIEELAGEKYVVWKKNEESLRFAWSCDFKCQHYNIER